MIEFEVMVRRITAPGGEMGTGSARDRALWRRPPALSPDSGPLGRHCGLIAALARPRALWQGSARLVGAFLADSLDPGTLP
jgi:hypothetical protein